MLTYMTIFIIDRAQLKHPSQMSSRGSVIRRKHSPPFPPSAPHIAGLCNQLLYKGLLEVKSGISRRHSTSLSKVTVLSEPLEQPGC